MKSATKLSLVLATLAITGCSPTKEKAATDLGFVGVKEMEEAQAQGWHTKAVYDKDTMAIAARAEAEDARKRAEAEAARIASIDLMDAKAMDEEWGLTATSRCDDGVDEYIRTFARYEHKWNSEATGAFGRKFIYVMSSVGTRGVLTKMTDAAMLQNGFGAYSPVRIYCDFDVRKKAVAGYRYEEN